MAPSADDSPSPGSPPAPTGAAPSTATAAERPARRLGLVTRSVGEYIRIHPFAVLLSLIVVATSLALGTLWGGSPDDLAAGVTTTVQAGAWWTPLTALFIPDAAIDLVLVLALTLTVGAYAERLLGTARAVLAYLLTGVLAVLLGVAVQSIALAAGDQWAEASQYDLVLDPAIGVVGLALTGSAAAPGLFRRRIRLLGFAALLMFALYAGDSDSLYRLFSAAIGLFLGLLLTRGRPQAPWRRSSVTETRTLIAAIVAVLGLGPLIVLISGVGNGPLALAVTGFRGIDLEALVERCLVGVDDLDAISDACAADLAVGVTATGAGPFLLSLAPLLLSLVAAWGLRRGRRAAWLLAIGVNLVMAALTAVSLARLDLVDAASADLVDTSLRPWAVVAVVLPLAVVLLLVLTRARFAVKAPRAAALRAAAIVAGAFVVLGGAYLLIALLMPQSLLVPATPGELLLDTLRRFLPPGLLLGVPTDVVPSDGLLFIMHRWAGVVFWVVVALVLLQLYRTGEADRSRADDERFGALLRRGGGGTLGFMGTWPGNVYWFAPDGSGAVAYRVINGVALTMSDPVCAPGSEAETIHGFADFCEGQGWAAVFYSVHDHCIPVFDDFGWQHMSVGEETVVPLEGFTLTGKPWAKVRQAYNRGEREGITTLWSSWDDLPSALAAEISAISEEWVSEKALPEMGFTLGGMDELKDPAVMLLLALGSDGRVQAITSWMPEWRDGRVVSWTIDFMRRGDESMPGIMEFVIASAALRMQADGVEAMSLSGAPLASKPVAPGEEAPEPTVMTRLLGWLAGVLEPAYGFGSLFRFKAKFNPEYRTIHMAYADPAALPAIGMAIGKAYLPHATRAEYLALVRTLTAGGKAE